MPFPIETPEALTLALRNGERLGVDLKMQAPESNVRGWIDTAKDLAAFANAEGGSILFGVNDGRVVVGLSPEKVSGHRAHVAEALKRCEPRPVLDIKELVTETKTVLVVMSGPVSGLLLASH